MKMSRKFPVVLFVVTALISSVSVSAQKGTPLRLGIGIDAGSTIKDPSRFTLGADARLQIPLGNSFSAIATTGYYHFFKNEDKGITEGVGIIPLKGGLKYFPVKDFYIAGEVGVGFLTKDADDNTSFVYSPSVGFAFANGLDVSLKYEDYTKYEGYASPLALRIAYGFKL